MPWLHRTSTKRKKKSQSYCTITVMRDSSQFRNVEWKFLFLQPLHSASSAWVPPPLPLWGPHSTSWQTRVNLCLNTGKVNIYYCLPWHLSWPTRDTGIWTVENAFNPAVIILFTTPKESERANKSSELVDRWDI